MAESIPEKFRVPVEVDGLKLVLDTRKVNSMEAFEILFAMSEEKASASDVRAYKNFVDEILGDQKQVVLDYLVERDGYADFREYFALSRRIVETAQKN